MSRYRNKALKIGSKFVTVILFFLIMLYILQRFSAHREDTFVPSYEKIPLNEETDYKTIFLQTGLGEETAKKLLREDSFEEILEAQDLFFVSHGTECVSLIGWFTREDRLVEAHGTEFADLQPGDILITLSTHSFGWRHGHAGLVIDENTVLECGVWGERSSLCSVDRWKNYSNYAVLRVKGISKEQQLRVKEYALSNLLGVPYHLSAGFIGEKAPETDESYFGLQCGYLVWYAWNHFGYDLDYNGGNLVLPEDLLYSDKLEVVQLFGMAPERFLY